MSNFIVSNKKTILYGVGGIVLLTLSYIIYNQFRIVKAYQNIVSLQEANSIILKPNMPIFDSGGDETENIAADEDYSYLEADDSVPEN